MSRNYSSISEVKTLFANVPETGAGSTQVILNEGTTGLPTVPFVLVLNPDTSNEEAVLATSLSGTTYTVTRNIEGGGVKSHTANQPVKHMIVGSDLQIPHDHIDNTTTAHGMNLKAPLAGPTFTGTVVLPSTTSIGNVSSTELGYVDGVTSAIQTQLNAKAPIAGPTFTGTVTLPTGTVTSNMILDGTIVNADINDSAAIAPSKIAGTAIVANDVSYLLPIGMLAPFAGSSAPTGWLLCAGQAVSRTTYSSLWTALGTTSSPYGQGDGSTTFNLPDLRGRVPAGVDNMGGTDAARLDWANTLGTSGGAQTHTLTTAEMPNHQHTWSYWDAVGNTGDNADGGARWDNSAESRENLVTIGTSFVGGGTAHNNMQPTLLLNYIIKH